MPIVVARGTAGTAAAQPVDEAGAPAGPPAAFADAAALAAYTADREADAGDGPPPRWVLPDVATTYPDLLAAGVRLSRAHDLALTAALLRGHAGEHAAPEDEQPDGPYATRAGQPGLFDPERPEVAPGDALAAAVTAYAGQVRAIAATGSDRRFDLLVAAESAGALAACEMTAAGIPWDAAAHDTLLRELLGAPDPNGGRPARLAELARGIADGFGFAVNPDSPADLLAAFRRSGYELTTTRAAVLQHLDHPATADVLAYKDLYRIHTAHGWTWLAAWVADGRFHPVYIPGGVVTGRWATRGGGALQIPKRLRGAVRADPGHVLVVADAGQADPRSLAAMSGDPAMAEAARSDDMYAEIATSAFGGDRSKAKVGLLGAMYGATGGQAAVPLATLRRRYPVALSLLERAARAGERGEPVSSHLGRTSAPAYEHEIATPSRARARGRFTRNFVVQATTAEWALSLLAGLRQRLTTVGTPERRADLVFFQHDEVVVHAHESLADEVGEAVRAAGADATRLLFGDTPVRFPLQVVASRSYADAAH